jgi:Holliday junction resolvasome RuvABC endonuclease subunit
MGKLDAYVGIDPGAKGALCLLVPDTKQVAFKSTVDKPSDLIAWLKQIQAELNLVVVMIEDVHSIFGVSAKSNFSFGYNVGVVNTVAIAAGCSVDRVTPKRWQKHVGVKTKGKAIKKDVANICERLYPDAPIRGSRGGLLDGNSDALMICHYASQTFKP